MAEFNDLDRRTLANLAIPRNVENLAHELRVDPYTHTRDASEVHEHLQDLEADGLVVNLGENPDPAAVAAKTPKRVYPWHDESREIYSRRLAEPRHRWRMSGDLWILSQDGLDRLREPTVESAPLGPSEVQRIIDSEWSRTLKDVDPNNVPEDQQLAQKLLADEFTAWATSVADECERVWGKNARPRLPLAGGAGWTDTYENYILDHENQKTSLATNDSISGTWYMALVILALGDTDTGTTTGDGSHVPTYTGYARKSVAAADMNAAASGSATNANAIIFAACTSGSSTIVGFGNCAASTAGLLKKYGTCSSTTVSTTQTPAQFAASAYTTTAD